MKIVLYELNVKIVDPKIGFFAVLTKHGFFVTDIYSFSCHVISLCFQGLMIKLNYHSPKSPQRNFPPHKYLIVNNLEHFFTKRFSQETIKEIV